MAEDREDFAAKDKAIIAGRAGYRCSFPLCRRPTIGPGAGSRETASIGVASHIYSASKNGPRGQGALTPDELRSPENGIWTCEDHAKLIDTSTGKRFPVSTLLAYRSLHEARVLFEMGGVKLPVSWVQCIRVLESPIFAPCQQLELAHVTVLLGDNGIGKSALCEWIASTSSVDSLERWHEADVAFELVIHTPNPHDVVVRLKHGTAEFELDKRPVPFNPLPVAVLTVAASPRREDDESDVHWLTRWLGISRHTLAGLVRAVNKEDNPFVEHAYIEDSEKVTTKLHREESPRSLGMLGASGVLLFVLGLTVIRGRHTSAHTPTLVVLDDVLGQFDDYHRSLIVEKFMREQEFQTVMTVPRTDLLPTEWYGWSLVRVAGKDGAALILAETEQ